LRALSGCGIWPSGEGSRPRGHANEWRIPRGGSLQESEFQVWPAAIDPQTPTLPGTERHPDFSHRRDATLILITAQPFPCEGSGLNRGRSEAPLRRVITPGAEVLHRAATVSTGEEIRLAGKCSRDVHTKHAVKQYFEMSISFLHILTDHGWVIKRHATVNVSRKCWWGTFYYGGGPCTALLLVIKGPVLGIFSEFLGLSRLKSRKVTCFCPGQLASGQPRRRPPPVNWRAGNLAAAHLPSTGERATSPPPTSPPPTGERATFPPH
jgi:hypothetical protein